MCRPAPLTNPAKTGPAKLHQGKLGPGELGPGELGPGKAESGARSGAGALARSLAAVALALAALALAAGPSPARAETRVALVVGNGAYAAVPRLPNPGRDAATIAEALRGAGFQSVTLAADLGRSGLIAALNAFAERAERADWAVVYFAGHGVEIGGVNYLVPVDARLRSDRDIGDEAVPLDRVLEALEPARKLRLVILDACRDNPFLVAMTRGLATRSVGRGLARVEPEAGTLIAFAAKHNQTALDGEGENGPFVRALVRRIATPRLEIGKLFRLVHDDVLAATDRRQEPHVYGSLPGEDFYFVSGKGEEGTGAEGTGAEGLGAEGPNAGASPPTLPAEAPARVAALPPQVLPPQVLPPQVLPPQILSPQVLPPGPPPPVEEPRPADHGNAPVNAPLVAFSRSNAGWHAAVSLPEPAIALSWRFGEAGPFRDTGFLDTLDPRTGRRLPDPAIALDPAAGPATLWIRYVDAAGATVGPFPIAFDPRAALRREQRRTVEAVGGGWLSFRDFNGVLIYYTALVSYRCAIKELRVGIDRAEPDRVVALPPCDEANPYAIPGDFVPYLRVPAGTRSVSARIVYTDGTVSPVRLFRR